MGCINSGGMKSASPPSDDPGSKTPSIPRSTARSGGSQVEPLARRSSELPSATASGPIAGLPPGMPPTTPGAAIYALSWATASARNGGGAFSTPWRIPVSRDRGQHFSVMADSGSACGCAESAACRVREQEPPSFLRTAASRPRQRRGRRGGASGVGDQPPCSSAMHGGCAARSTAASA